MQDKNTGNNTSFLSSRIKKTFLIFACFVIILFLYQLFFARLFPFSPFIWGFKKSETEKYLVYWSNEMKIDCHAFLPTILSEIEDYHGIKFKEKPILIFCSSDKENQRYTGSKARFVAINGRVFISKRAIDDSISQKISLNVYLKHELSHVLLQQYLGAFRTLKMPKWILEGVAMDCASQVGTGIYPSKAEIVSKIKNGIFAHPKDYGNYFSEEKGSCLLFPLDKRVSFLYSEFGTYFEFLRNVYGEKKEKEFFKILIESREFNPDKSITAAFGVPGDVIFLNFIEFYRNQR